MLDTRPQWLAKHRGLSGTSIPKVNNSPMCRSNKQLWSIPGLHKSANAVEIYDGIVISDDSE